MMCDARVAVVLIAAVMLGISTSPLLVTLWGGFNLIVRQHLGNTYHEAMEFLPRLLLGALLVNTSRSWGRLAIDANNALCQAIGQASLPGNAQAAEPNCWSTSSPASSTWSPVSFCCCGC